LAIGTRSRPDFDQGLVTSAKGHGGGWMIDCDPAAVILADI
jgi:DNA-binding IscR family transcriptional regulator